VVGPIGSGKSSMLDAVTFALYGRTPVVGSKTRSLIHQLADLAQVELVYEVEGEVWRVQRAIRRRGQSQHKLEHLAEDVPGAAVLETVTQERPVNERIAAQLGLAFDAFCRSVMLAQNRFAEFLKATPTQRNDVLQGVFGYERFERAQAIAKTRVAVATATIAALDDEARRLADATASLDEARAAEAAAAALVRRFDERWEAIAAAVSAAAAGRRAAETHAAETEAIAAVARSLPDARIVAETVTAAVEADEMVAEAERAAAQAEAALDEAVAAREALTASAGDLRAFAELVATHELQVAARADAEERAAAARGRAARMLEEADGARSAHEAAERAAAEAAGSVVRAEATRAEAETRLQEARHGQMAAELRSGLHAGDPCPVCGRDVDAVPPPIPAAELEAAQVSLAEADEALAGARRDSVDATATLASAASQAETARSAAETAEADAIGAAAVLAAAEVELARINSELVDRLGEGDPRQMLETREGELREAERAEVEARRAQTAARTGSDLARSAGAAAAEAIAALAGALTNAWGRLGEERAVPPDAARMPDADAEVRAELEARRSAAEHARAEAVNAVTAADAELAGHLEALGLAPDSDPVQARSGAQASHAAAAQRVEGLEAVVAAAADLGARLARSTADRDLAARLAADLQPSRLLAFALEEERAALAELGSAHLAELTGDAFRFAEDDTFAIADQLAGGATRAPESLSGGETFLASLALALALAEMVARGRGRLDAFFLDEGFGSLDPEHLDRAMQGIERLVAGGDRLVVVVSHVEQMRQTIEDLIELDKDDRTGDTVIVRGASTAG
jgi:exonuclease SbcC